MIVDSIIHELPLPLLEKVGDNWHFRCVVCGDSKKSATKKRGWILTDRDKPRYYCFNCGHSEKLLPFLKVHYPPVAKSYIKIAFKGRHQRRKEGRKKLVQTKAAPVEETGSKLDLPKISQLPSDHEAVQYLKGRKMPVKYFRYLLFAENFQEYVNELIPGKFENPRPESRIVIPFYNAHRKVFAFQGRSLEEDAYIRYITIKLTNHKKIFGLERMSPYKTILVFEGPLDSLFMPNAVAFGGADLDLNYLLELAPKDRYIFCFDNEPRNKEMCDRIEKILKKGFKVCLMPLKYKKYGKDVNKMIENGMTAREICCIIKENIVQGKMGLMKFKLWKKGK
jgi:DNA primase